MENTENKVDLTFPEKIILLALDDKGWFGNSENSIKFGLAGALIFELIIAGKIEIRDFRIHVLDQTRVTDPILEKAFDLIRNSKKERSIKSWIQRIVYRKMMLRKVIIKSLIAKKIVRKEEYNLMRVFYQFKYPLTDQGLKIEIQKDLAQKILEDKDLSDKDLMLLTVINSCKMIRKNFHHFEHFVRVSKRIREITKFETPHNEMVTIIKEIQQAISRAIVSSNVSLHI